MDSIVEKMLRVGAAVASQVKDVRSNNSSNNSNNSSNYSMIGSNNSSSNNTSLNNSPQSPLSPQLGNGTPTKAKRPLVNGGGVSSAPRLARQMFSFSELAGTDLTLLMEEALLIRVFSFLSYPQLFIAKRVCSRWKPLCESRTCYSDLDMQGVIACSRYIPRPILNHFFSTLSMQHEEIEALKMVCREMPRDESVAHINQIELKQIQEYMEQHPNLQTSTSSTTSSTSCGINIITTTAAAAVVSTPPSPSLESLSLESTSLEHLNGHGDNTLRVNGEHSRGPSYGGGDTTDYTLTGSNSSNGSLSSSYESPSLTSSTSSSSNTPTSYRKSVAEKEKQRREKQRKEREKRMEEALKVWTEDIIPNWDKKKTSKKVRDLIYQGIPSLARSKVWPLIIGNDLNITPELFSIFGARAERAKQKGDASLGREGTVTLIQLDLPRTFPMLSIFQNEGPLHQSLANVLEAYVCYRPDVGYVQGMSYLAALFLLILDEYNSFVCLANLLNNPCYMAFYTMNMSQMEIYMKAMDSLMASNLPKLHRHLTSMGIQPDVFMIDWVLTIFSKALPLDVASHVWDNLFLEGELFIFQAALGILKMYSKELESGDFDACMTLLTHLPQDIDDDELFQHISSFTINPKVYSKLISGCDK